MKTFNITRRGRFSSMTIETDKKKAYNVMAGIAKRENFDFSSYQMSMMGEADATVDVWVKGKKAKLRYIGSAAGVHQHVYLVSVGNVHTMVYTYVKSSGPKSHRFGKTRVIGTYRVNYDRKKNRIIYKKLGTLPGVRNLFPANGELPHSKRTDIK